MGQQQTTTSERIDELPLVIQCLKQIQVDLTLDPDLGRPMGTGMG